MARTRCTSVLPLGAVVLLGCFSVSLGGESCVTGRSFYGHRDIETYCPESCCGEYPHGYCCSYDPIVGAGAIAGIIGACIAGVCMLAILVRICLRRQGSYGRLVNATPALASQPSVTVVSTATSAQYPATQYPGNGYNQPMGGQPQKPPAYSPPAYNYNDPTFPPSANGFPTNATTPFNNAAGNA